MSEQEKKGLEKADAQKMLSWALTDKLEGTPNDADPDLPGFEILNILGRGGMGTVYKARHDGLGRTVALKVFTARGGGDHELFIERLKREGRLMAQLEHPNVLGIYDADMLSDGTPYLVLEYVKGDDLQKRIYESKRLKLKEAIRVAVKVCNGISAVHSLGVIHRDIKPANVLLGDDGSVKVTDFGVSKETSAEDRTALTMTGTAIGTVDYMSPEQSNGGTVDERSDIYSIGVMLYEMIAGVTPRGAFEPLAKYGAPKDLDRLVMRCLQRDPNKRPDSAASVAMQLKRVYKQLRGRKVQKASSGIYAALAGLACIGVLAMFIAREIREKKSGGEVIGSSGGGVVTGGAVAQAKEGVKVYGQWIDLVDGLDVQEASLSGQWWKHENKLITNSSTAALIEFAEPVSGRYAVRLNFTRVSGEGTIVVVLPTELGSLSVVLGSDSIEIPELGEGSKGVSEKRLHDLQLGVAYSLTIDVRGGKVIGKLDDATWAEWQLEEPLRVLPRRWRRVDEGRIGLGVTGAQVIFNESKVVHREPK
ncbi:serine/threonine protein kinase [Rubritalea tangerina]|uniref:Serine/threonine protein kinase n=1 Tax=Rubritalea tangerina TaxID=430798 RepID=A0ABW4Z821_9BACT